MTGLFWWDILFADKDEFVAAYGLTNEQYEHFRTTGAPAGRREILNNVPPTK